MLARYGFLKYGVLLGQRITLATDHDLPFKQGVPCAVS